MTGDIDVLRAEERARLAAALADWGTPDYLAVRALTALSADGDHRVGRLTAMGRQFAADLRRRAREPGGVAGLLDDAPCLRERILEAASTQIVHADTRTVTVGTVSRETGIPRRTVYNLYASSEELAQACRRRNHTVWRAHFEQRVLSASAAPRERLPAVFATVDEWVGSARFRGDEALRAPATFADELRDDDLREHLAEIERFATALAFAAKLGAPAVFAAFVVTCVAGAIGWLDRRGSARDAALACAQRFMLPP
jgi:AcrR family transcriptional regulator